MMTDDRIAKRRAYETAKAHQRGYYERYYPVRVLGGRAAEPVTAEVLVEIERLKTATETARVEWEASRQAAAQGTAQA
jgi:hypothetical protein